MRIERPPGAMLRSTRSECLTAAVLMAPFVVIYAVLFVYPTLKMVELSLHQRAADRAGQMGRASTIISGSRRTVCSRSRSGTRSISSSSRSSPARCSRSSIALGVNRLKGWLQSIVLAAFFLPYILPVSVVYRIWSWMFDKDFGVAQYVIAPLNDGQHLSVFRTIPLFMPAVAFVTVWWLLGFSVLLFIAGLRNISSEIYEAAELDGAGRWTPVPAHHLAADLAGHGARLHHPAHPAAQDLRSGLSVRPRRPRRRQPW